MRRHQFDQCCLVVWPNITGSFWGGQYFYCFNQAFGMFELADQSERPYQNALDSGEELLYAAVNADASRVSNLYAGSNLQPRALSVLPCIRY